MGIAQSVALRSAMNQGKTEAKEDASEETAKELAEATSGLLLNMGVVGALILTMVFPLLLTPEVDVASAAVDFFGEDAARGLRSTYQALLAASFSMGCILIVRTVEMYKVLSPRAPWPGGGYSTRATQGVSFWMPDTASKLWFMQRFALLPIVALANTLFFCLFVTVLVGSAVQVGPRLAIFLLAGGIAFLILAAQNTAIMATCTFFLHSRAHVRTRL
jgi:hypothetical protein